MMEVIQGERGHEVPVDEGCNANAWLSNHPFSHLLSHDHQGRDAE